MVECFHYLLVVFCDNEFLDTFSHDYFDYVGLLGWWFSIGNSLSGLDFMIDFDIYN